MAFLVRLDCSTRRRSVCGLADRRSPPGAKGADRTVTSRTARSGSSSDRRTHSAGPRTVARATVRPIWTRAEPEADPLVVSGPILTVILRISPGLRPSLRRWERARRSVLRRELIAARAAIRYRWVDTSRGADSMVPIYFVWPRFADGDARRRTDRLPAVHFIFSRFATFRNDEQQESPIAAAPTCTATHQYNDNEMFSYCICDCSDVSRFIFVLFSSMCFHTICRSLPSTKLHVFRLPSSPSSTCQFKYQEAICSR